MMPHTREGEQVTEVKGAGLARGPAMIIGTILSVAGLALFLHAGDTSTAGFPDGDVVGSKLLGFESNGWTAWITTAAGVLLLFGAAQHLLAKAMSLVVGLALAVCVVISLIDGDVLGLAAANWAVELAWAIAAVILLLNLLSPRIRHREHVDAAPAGPMVEDRTAAPGDRGPVDRTAAPGDRGPVDRTAAPRDPGPGGDRTVAPGAGDRGRRVDEPTSATGDPASRLHRSERSPIDDERDR